MFVLFFCRAEILSTASWKLHLLGGGSNWTAPFFVCVVRINTGGWICATPVSPGLRPFHHAQVITGAGLRPVGNLCHLKPERSTLIMPADRAWASWKGIHRIPGWESFARFTRPVWNPWSIRAIPELAPGGNPDKKYFIKKMGKFACTTLYIGGTFVPVGTGYHPWARPPPVSFLKHSFLHDAGIFSRHPGNPRHF
jgi:hypothetical protein